MEKLLGLPPVASEHGAHVDALIIYVHWLMIILFVGWLGYFAYVLLRFRRGRNPQADYYGVRNHASSYLEAAVALVEGILLVGLAVALHPASVQACAACYGQSDAPMAAGMNWGILSLFGMVVMVLGGIGAFFVYLARRSATISAAKPAQPASASSEASWGPQQGTSLARRGGMRKHWLSFAYQYVGRIGHCCARGQAHSSAAALGGARKITPEVN